MLTPEQSRVLDYLRKHPAAMVDEVARACLPGSSPGWLDRVLTELDWLGYVTVVSGAGGPAFLQITDRGRAQARASA